MPARNDERATERAAVVAAARRVSAETGVSAAVLLAVAIAETAGVPHARFEGRAEPLIRFEGHYFDRLLPAEKRGAARAAGLADPKAGGVRNPASQAARWHLLDRAGAIDAGAAYAATSWGLGQVMGAHWRKLGHASPQALADIARGSIDGQFRLMAGFLRLGDLHRRLERGAFADFARLYNGPAYRRNGYDAKIERAFAEAGRWLAKPPGAAPEVVPAPVRGSQATPAKRAKGWSIQGNGLSDVVSWLMHRFSIPSPTRFFSTSTALSSDSATIPAPSGSNPRSFPS